MAFQIFHWQRSVGYMLITEADTDDMPVTGEFFPQATGFTPNVTADNEYWTVWV